MSALWVIPCRFDPERPVIFDCVQAIQHHHPGARIMVIDSASPDCNYLDKLHDWGVGTVVADNMKYGPGAFKYAWNDQPKVDFFYFVFDSLIVNANLDHLQARPLTAVRWFDSDRHGWGWNDDTGQPLDDWARAHHVEIPDHYRGIMGPMLMARRETIARADLFRLLPTNRFEQCALERCWGIWLQRAGYDVREGSLQGEHLGHFDAYDETFVTKREMHRA